MKRRTIIVTQNLIRYIYFVIFYNDLRANIYRIIGKFHFAVIEEV